MAFVDSDGRNISFECSALIDELKQDIAIMGEDRVVAVWCKPYGNVTLYTNYDFIIRRMDTRDFSRERKCAGRKDANTEHIQAECIFFAFFPVFCQKVLSAKMPF